MKIKSQFRASLYASTHPTHKLTTSKMAHLIPRRPIINNFTHLGPHGIINDILRKKNLKVLPSPINVKYSNKKQRTLEKIKEEKGDKTY